MRKKLVSLIILTLIIILCTSCNGSRELDELGIVSAVALDLENEKIILTVEVIIPSATAPASTAEEKVIYVQSTGDTIAEAYSNATLDFDKILYVPHNMIVIFGSEFAKRGIGDYMIDFLNDSEPRETAYMLVAINEKAYNLVGIDGGLSVGTGNHLQTIIENQKFNSKTRRLSIYEYFKYFYRNGTPVLGVVERIEVKEVNKKGGKDRPDKAELNLMGGAVFRRDKLEGYYTGDEMIGFNYITNQVEGGLIVFQVPEENIDNKKLVATKGKFTTIEIISSKTKNNIEIVDGKMHLNINVKIKGTLAEETKGLNVSDLSVKDEIQLACSKKVEEYIKTTMDKAQKEFQIDSFSINDLVYIKYPEVWKQVSSDWNNSVFPNISYSVKVDTKMVRTGLMNIPVNVEKGREQ